MAGNRSDGTVIKDLDGFHAVIPYMMAKRTESEVASTESFDVTDLLKYIKERNEKECSNLKIFHAVCTALARTIYLRPKINIFIAGKRYYQRNKVLLSFVAKQKFEDTAEETLMCLDVKPEMNIDDISHKILGDVEHVRKEKTNELGGILDFLAKLPRFLNCILWGIIRILDFYGIMPDALTRGDPNFTTALISNLGSIGAKSPSYHHLSNYGTCSIMATIGTVQKRKIEKEDGTAEWRDILEIAFTFDERIADGFYFAKSIRVMRYLLEHPEILTETVTASVPVET